MRNVGRIESATAARRRTNGTREPWPPADSPVESVRRPVTCHEPSDPASPSAIERCHPRRTIAIATDTPPPRAATSRDGFKPTLARLSQCPIRPGGIWHLYRHAVRAGGKWDLHEPNLSDPVRGSSRAVPECRGGISVAQSGCTAGTPGCRPVRDPVGRRDRPSQRHVPGELARLTATRSCCGPGRCRSRASSTGGGRTLHQRATEDLEKAQWHGAA